MLFAVECPFCHNRIWADVTFDCERRVYASNLLDLEEYILKHARVRDVYKEKDIILDIKKTLAGLLKGCRNPKQVIIEVAELHGIPVSVVEEILENLLVEVREV
ncbi:hypothetical protein DRP07_00750 [Archaeoglobales archaeon]|nr:MAG: hypothetical protein DRP07_00750 [Archaeoglobales archaeon]